MNIWERGGLAWLALAGLASPLVLATSALVIAGRRPDYSHLRHTLSELGSLGRPHAEWMNRAGVVPAGLLVVLAAPALYAAFGAGRLSVAGALVLALAGACFAGTGLFPWAGAPGDFSAPTSKAHFVLAMMAFACLPLVPLLFGLHARGLPALSTWSTPSYVAAAAVFVFGFLPLPGWLGATQRASLACFFAWLVTASLWTLRSP